MKNKIKEVRLSQKKSRYKMALDLGISYNTLINWEASESLGIDKIELCAKYLQVKKTELI